MLQSAVEILANPMQQQVKSGSRTIEEYETVDPLTSLAYKCFPDSQAIKQISEWGAEF